MSSYLALAVSVGVLAIVATWLFFSVDPVVAAHMQVWQAFIAWGCHYHSGGKITGTTKTIVCMSFGAVVGMTAGVLAGGALASLGQFAAPVAVGLGAAVICLASKVPGPKSGFHAGSFIFRSSPSYSPSRITARFFRATSGWAAS